MRASVLIEDIVGESEQGFSIFTAVLQSDFHMHSFIILVHIKNIFIFGFFVLIQMADIGSDTAFKIKLINWIWKLQSGLVGFFFFGRAFIF